MEHKRNPTLQSPAGQNFHENSVQCYSCKRMSHGFSGVDILPTHLFTDNGIDVHAISNMLSKFIVQSIIEEDTDDMATSGGQENILFSSCKSNFIVQSLRESTWWNIMTKKQSSGSSDFAHWWDILLKLNQLYNGSLNVEAKLTKGSQSCWDLQRICLPHNMNCLNSGLSIRNGCIFKHETDITVYAPSSLELALRHCMNYAQMRHDMKNEDDSDHLINMGPASIAVLQNWEDLFLKGRLVYADGHRNELVEAPSFADELNNPIPVVVHDADSDFIAQEEALKRKNDYLWSSCSAAHTPMGLIIDAKPKNIEEFTNSLSPEQIMFQNAWQNTLKEAVEKDQCIYLNSDDADQLSVVSERIVRKWRSFCTCDSS